MVLAIEQRRTGKRIRWFIQLRGFSVQDVKEYLSLGCVQSVYHWLDGQSLPSLDNLYALSELLKIPMELLIVGNRRSQRSEVIKPRSEHLLSYCQLIEDGMSA